MNPTIINWNDPDEVKAYKQDYQRRYYRENCEKIKAYNREYQRSKRQEFTRLRELAKRVSEVLNEEK